MFIDPRGPRFAAAVTSIVLAAVLVSGSRWLLAAQAVVFALGVANRSPYTLVFRRLVQPRLTPPAALEDVRPLRFAQAVGLGFVLAAGAALALGGGSVANLLIATALVAALLNAAIGFCLGCEIYLLARRSSLLPAVRPQKEIHA